jgi:hypothetical protein
MVANTSPIYVDTPNIGIGTITTANTAMDGTGTVVTIFTAGADGAFVDSVVVRGLGTNIATVLRLFLNNGGTNATATNNALLADTTLPATTASNVQALAPVDIALGVRLPAGWKINATIGTTVAAGYALSGHGGDF